LPPCSNHSIIFLVLTRRRFSNGSHTEELPVK
jgi:hypothetical protein